MKKLLFIIAVLYSGIQVNAQVSIKWAYNYGGYNFDRAHSIQQTIDSGYIVAGRTESNDGDVTGHIGSYDSWIVKLDNLGIIEWETCLGGNDGDISYDIQQTLDGGYITVGSTRSSINKDSSIRTNRKAFIAKLNTTGTIEWQKSIEQGSIANSVELTSDGGFVVAGGTGTGGGGWVGKFDDLGNDIWDFYFTGIDATSIKQTNDGGYIVTGPVYTETGINYVVIKLGETGIEEWSRNYGGSGNESPHSICNTIDGGYIVVGRTSNSNDGDVSGNHNIWEDDIWLLKINNLGNIEWQKCLGGLGGDIAYSIAQTADYGYIVAGFTLSNDGDVMGNHGGEDFWIVKLDNLGIIEWQKCLGGSKDDRAYSIQQLLDGNYIVTGESRSDNGDVVGNHGSADFWAIELCLQTPLEIVISSETYCYTTELIASNNFEEYLWNTGDTTQTIIINSGGYYSVIGYNQLGCPTETVMIAPPPIQPYNQSEICLVTLDDDSEKNVIIYEPVQGVGIDSIMIYRKNNITSDYEWIGSRCIEDEGLFIDQNANPQQQSYEYKIGVRDTCGKTSGLSSTHRTMLLQSNMGINNEVNLFWNAYEGFEYSNFGIYRSTNQSEYVLIANVANNSYTYIDLYPPTGENKYQVRVEKESSCNTEKTSYIYASSNPVILEPFGVVEEVYNGIKIYPNPFGDNITIERNNKQNEDVLEIVDPFGTVVGKYKINSGEKSIIISTKNLVSGLYFLRSNRMGGVKIVKQ